MIITVMIRPTIDTKKIQLIIQLFIHFIIEIHHHFFRDLHPKKRCKIRFNAPPFCLKRANFFRLFVCLTQSLPVQDLLMMVNDHPFRHYHHFVIWNAIKEIYHSFLLYPGFSIQFHIFQLKSEPIFWYIKIAILSNGQHLELIHIF